MSTGVSAARTSLSPCHSHFRACDFSPPPDQCFLPVGGEIEASATRHPAPSLIQAAEPTNSLLLLPGLGEVGVSRWATAQVTENRGKSHWMSLSVGVDHEEPL